LPQLPAWRLPPYICFTALMNIDGSMVDIASVVSAILCALVKPWRVRYLNKHHLLGYPRHNSSQGRVVADLLNGACLVPFALLTFSVFSSTLLKAALESSKVSMALGGLIGVVFVAGEIYRLPPSDPESTSTPADSIPISSSNPPPPAKEA
jgi:hypothetical protein